MQIVARGGPHAENVIAVAAEPFHFARQLAPRLRYSISRASGYSCRTRAICSSLGCAGTRLAVELAKRKTRRVAVSRRAALQSRSSSGGELEQGKVGVYAIDPIVEAGQLRSHARVDLDQPQLVGFRVPGHLEVEKTVPVTDAGQHASGKRLHPLLRRGRCSRGVFEAAEGVSAGIHVFVITPSRCTSPSCTYRRG